MRITCLLTAIDIHDSAEFLLTLKRGPGSMLLVDPPRVLVRLPFRGFTQIFVDSSSPFADMFIISAE